MSRLVTLLAVVALAFTGRCWKDDGGAGASSVVGEPILFAAEMLAALFFPKLSFHLLGFLVTGAGVTDVVEEMEVARCASVCEVAAIGVAKSCVGTAYMAGGSNGMRPDLPPPAPTPCA